VDERHSGEGWLICSGIVLMMAGVMRFFDGLWSLRYGGPVPGNLQDAILGDSLTTYGWTWIIVGAILFVAGLGVLTRSQLARWTGIVAASIGAITATLWMPYYPGWSIVYVILAFFVIYGLATYGGHEVPVR
jgi:uncharacterized membrane protein HdeD (DUF308 family)